MIKIGVLTGNIQHNPYKNSNKAGNQPINKLYPGGNLVGMQSLMGITFSLDVNNC
jgi:hypothetical protein